MAELLRLIVSPDTGPGKFIARLEGSDKIVVQGTRQPLVDGARLLLGRGLDPATPFTMRHDGKTYDSFRPAALGHWAGQTYEEGERRSLRSSLDAVSRVGIRAKVGYRAVGGTGGPSAGKSLLRRYPGGWRACPMIGATYEQAAAAYAAAGIVPLPLGGEDGKRPLVRHPGKFGPKAALQIAPKFPDANLGFWCGERNGLTVVDIDSAADAELQHAIYIYGDSPVIVRTASGKAHVYYRHGGERRRIRPDKGHPIDILGEGGLAVAPPSIRPSGGAYQFVRGGLNDLRRLPMIKHGAVQPVTVPQTRRPAGGTPHVVTAIGQRNNTMFRLACALAQTANDREALLAQVRAANVAQSMPLPDDELQKTVGSAWRYRERGSLMVPGVAESSLILPASIAEHAMATGNLDVAGLMMMVRKYHSEPGKVFALSPVALATADKIKGWSPNRYRYAIREAIDLGLLVLVHMGGRGKRDPSLYRCAT